MHSSSQTILVVGATGQQGGATARHLLAEGWRVRALVRDTESPAALQLREAGTDLATGDLDDIESLDAAAGGAYGVFGVTPVEMDPRREAAQGRNLVDAAQRAGVSHFVFASVGGAERGTGIPFWEVKREVEEYLRASGPPATVLRPVRFMENHAAAAPVGGITGATLVHVFAPEVPVQLIAVDDIGAFAALAFADPGTYTGQAIELAGDELPSSEVVRLISEAVGRPVAYRQWLRDEPSGMGEETDRAHAPVFDLAADLTEEKGFWQADIPALRKSHPGLQDFRTWLRNGGAARIAELL